MTPLVQHQLEIQKNLRAWHAKPLLRAIYDSFYRRILALIDSNISGRVVEIGSGIGNLKAHLPDAITTDLFPNPWLDVVCDGYDLPFRDGSISHLVLFDVWHHLRAPNAFLNEARRVLGPHGRVILFEPHISWASFPVYGLLHHEPVALRGPINLQEHLPRPRDYYAAQGNATRLFFKRELGNWPAGWKLLHARAISSFSYLLSGGYSKPALYPASWLELMQQGDELLNCCPRLFGARCLVALEKN
jgi:SAM-dependent methyltransferase